MHFAWLLAVACFHGCTSQTPDSRSGGDSAEETRPLLGFGVLARPSPTLAHRGYQPLMEYLTRRTGFRLQVRLANSEEDLAMYLEERIAEVAQIGIVNYIDAGTRFPVMAIVKPLNREGRAVTRTVFVAPRESSLRSVTDLSNRSLAFGPAHSTLAHFIPRLELKRWGMGLEELKSWACLDSEDAVAEAVMEGRFDAGVMSEETARRWVEGSAQLRVLQASEPVPTAPFVVRGDLPAAVRRALTQALLSIKADPAEQRMHWHESIRYGFVAATDGDYDGLRRLTRQALPGCVAQCHVDHVSLGPQDGGTR